MSNPVVEFSWPPPFTLRHSRRVRSVRLQMCVQRGLQLVVPMRFNANKAPAVLEEHRAWIQRTWSRIQPRTTNAADEPLPTEIKLLALDKVWRIDYAVANANNRLRLQMIAPGQLLFQGATNNPTLARVLLRRWAQQQAQLHLLPWLDQISKQIGLDYAKASTRHASTRWGSCSAQKNISLNYKLLFLAPEIVEYIIIHELCHTVHMNHSQRFWNLVAKFNPDHLRWRQELKEAHLKMPAWVTERD